MSAPLVDLPSQPERARVKHSGTIAAEATGFQSAMQEGLQKPSLSKTSDRPRDPIFAYFEKETEKRHDASFVFLLWGSENSESFKTWAVDVPVPDDAYEDEIFEALRKKYYKELGFSGILNVFQRFKRLKPVTFRFICRDSKRFLAFVEPVDLDSLHKRYSEKLEEAWKSAKLITFFDMPDDPPDCCSRDSSGEYNHGNPDCPTNRYLEDPDYTTFHEFGYQNRYLELTGLYVETAWCPVKSGTAFLSILLPSIVIGGRFFWGSWEVAFGAGSFIIALPMLALAVLNRYDA
ncbi:hypothetical protein COCCADRAFT_38702 [Bipolaris zeicola 26-R-13]|uniref:Uncharacterized protein n=1 Tax=Cochliobolus carbonum (strain 26-R-13) TaxID=930089 RepID=W6YIS4_COCC2|nr:uncharacterized protein COCCADRAFT_38702 [Bipolaris zeicola 26-R-13]EUC31186.1 hypothetical protein COCCADRAFT_38702 [Bipolaris zeicola 26-R-13]